MGHKDPLIGELALRFEAGMACIEARQGADALNQFDAVLAENPTCERALCGRGSAHRLLGRPSEALRDFNAALELDPQYPRAYFNRGLLHFAQGDIDNALTDFEIAIKLQTEPGFFFNRGDCLLKLERYAAAVSDFDATIQIDPEQPHSYFYRGIAQANLRNLSAACQDFDFCVSRNYFPTASLSWKAYCECLQKKYLEAIASLDHAIVLDSNDLTLRSQRASALLEIGEYEDAVHDLDQCILNQPHNEDLLYSRGLAWKNLNNYDASIADLDSAIERRPDFAKAFWARGEAHLELSECHLALSDLSQAIKLQPSEPFPYVLRAAAWRTECNDESALTDLNKALELKPNSKRALRARSQLYTDLGDRESAEADLQSLDQIELTSTQEHDMTQRKTRISMLLAEHFSPESVADLTITIRKFPFRVRADLQRAVDRLFAAPIEIDGFYGVKRNHSYETMTFSDLIYSDPHNAALAVPPEYEELDIGESDPVRCLKTGLWLARQGDQKLAVLLAPAKHHGESVGLQFQIAVAPGAEGVQFTQHFFKLLEEAVAKSESYRGKILSLEIRDHYSGMSSGIFVHKLRTVEREQVILPQNTLNLLDRNIIEFSKQRKRLAEHGLSTKKGLLFYGPPGTGKTHTIHYLAAAMQGHTTLLITAEQVGLINEYMTLARLLQPSIVVIEDADLIARDRNKMESACEEVLLNKLLNEMDGLRPNTDVIFILTTNRPETLEAALASRPGRIDQAIEFPLPDEDGRRKLISLYSHDLNVPDDVVNSTVKRTERVSASFIKELVRRAAQFCFERNSSATIELEDVNHALEELLFAGGTLNRSLLGIQTDEV
jgi:cell division protease FtsH